jgi:hypothetical protein
MEKRPLSAAPRVDQARRIAGAVGRGIVGALVVMCACTHDWDRDNPALHGGADSSVDDVFTSDSPGNSDVFAPVHCPPGGGGPAFISVPNAGGGFCVGATEVTRSQYAAFLATNPATGSQGANCASNTTFVPSSSWPPTSNDTHPVTFVDWCDAVAFCQWTGGHLCGGKGGAPYDPMYSADPSISEWYGACSAGGSLTYPYGNTYEPGACNGRDNEDGGILAPTPVASLPACVGGEPGVFDMSGNVFEWDSACVFDSNNPSNSLCSYRGGDYESGQDQLGCGSMPSSLAIGQTFPTIGFRCCANGVASDAGVVADASAADSSVVDSSVVDVGPVDTGSAVIDAAKDVENGQ